MKSRSTISFLRDLAHREVDLHTSCRDAEVVRVFQGASHVRGLEELLGRHAAAVQARPTDLVALDEGDVEPGRRAVEGGGVATGSPSDYDYIELLDLVRHGLSLQIVE